jgi:filamentous hemagglutinin
MKSRLQLQTLESRQVPAILVNPSTLTYQDVDGDLVTVKLNKNVLTADNIATVFTFDGGSFGDNSSAQSLKLIDLTSLSVKGANLSVTAKKLLDGKASTANVGTINATGIDLNSVLVSGDLGKIEAGDDNRKTAGLASLTVGSMGMAGPLPGDDLYTEIIGSLGKLTVRGDIQDALIHIEGNLSSAIVTGSLRATSSIGSGFDVLGNINSVKVGGDLIGLGGWSGSIIALGSSQEITKTKQVYDADLETYIPTEVVVGYRLVGGNIGSVTVGGNVEGAMIGSDVGSVRSVKIKGSLIGSVSDDSGSIFARSTTESILVGNDMSGVSVPVKLGGNIGLVEIGDSMVGGEGYRTGSIIAREGNIGTVKVGGEVIGGMGTESASILASGSTKPLTTTRRIPGEIGEPATTQTFTSGYQLVGGTIGSVTVKGSVLGGSGEQSGAIGATFGSIKQIKIGGSLMGGGDYAGSIFAQSTVELLTVGEGGSEVDVPIKLGGNIGAISIGAAVIGSNGLRSGSIAAVEGNIGSINIAGDLIGGSGEQAGSVYAKGSVKPITKTYRSTFNDPDEGPINFSNTIITDFKLIGGRIGSATVGGAVIGGSSSLSGSIGTDLGSIGSIRIKGDLIGGTENSSGFLFAYGTESETELGKKVPLGGTIGNIRIDGSVTEADIYADRSLQTLTVGRNWNSGNIAVGTYAHLPSLANSSLKIGSITIAGTIGGDLPPTTGTDEFTAPTIGALKVGKKAIKLTKGSANDTVDLTSLVKLVEFDAHDTEPT